MPVPCSELAKTLTDLAMHIASQPGKGSLDAVVAEIQKTVAPEITRQIVADAIVDATTGHARALTDIQQTLADVKREAKNDKELRGSIASLEKHVSEGTQPPAPKPDRPAPAAIEKLREQRDALQKRIDEADPAAREAVKARIAELEKHIQAGTVPPKRVERAAPADLQALRDQRDELYRKAQQADPAKRQAIRDQIAEIQKHINAGTHPAPKPAKAAPADMEALRAERDKLAAKLRQDSPQVIEQLKAKIATLSGHLKAGTLPEPSGGRAAPAPPKVQALRDVIAGLERKLSQSEPAQRKRIEASIERLNGQMEALAAGEFVVPEPKTEAVPQSKAIERLAYERDRLRQQVRAEIDALKPKPPLRKVAEWAAEPVNLLRSVMTSFDASAVLRQGGFIALGHPIRAAKAIPDMLRAMVSAPAAHRINTEIINRPNAPLYDRAGLYLASDHTAKLGQKEEAFMSKLVGKIPGLAGSERAYNTFLNRLRADSFDQMAHGLARNSEVTQAEAEAIAGFINAATGRGKLPGSLEHAGSTLNTVFFAPRYWTSRIQLLAGEPLYHGTGSTRKAIAAEYGRFLAGLGTVYALGTLAGGSVNLTDPRSSDFGKIRFGQTSVDPLMGLSQNITFGARVATGQSVNLDGKVTNLRGPKHKFGEQDTMDTVSNLLRSKLAPIPGSLLNIAQGKDMIGQPATIASEAQRLATPMVGRDIYEAIQAEGVPKGTALGILTVFGMGIQTRQNKKKPDTAHR